MWREQKKQYKMCVSPLTNGHPLWEAQSWKEGAEHIFILKVFTYVSTYMEPKLNTEEVSMYESTLALKSILSLSLTTYWALREI